MAHRPEFDPNRPLVAARGFRFAGLDYEKGDPFPGPRVRPGVTFARRLIERQYSAGAVNHAGYDDKPETADAADADPITITGPRGGRYTIKAPWLDEPVVIRGKVLAEQALAKLREEGAPLGWIEGGSEVEIEDLGGGWYQITAPWLDEPEKEQGRDKAEARQRELHEAGKPEPEEPETGGSGADPALSAENTDDTNASKAQSAETGETGAGDQDDAGSDETADAAGEGQEAGEPEGGEKDNEPEEGTAGA